MAEFTLPAVDQIHGKQLAYEIEQATGLTITTEDVLYQGNGIVFVRDQLIQGQDVAVQAVVDLHVPDYDFFPEDAELNRQTEVEESAESDASTVPGWASWSKSSANDWFSTNVEDLLAAIPDVDGLPPQTFETNDQAIIAQMQDIINAQAIALKNLGHLVIALRNKVWPNLQEEE
jgi:hypothetical protein